MSNRSIAKERKVPLHMSEGWGGGVIFHSGCHAECKVKFCK
jgi:hypothetical protein